MKPSDKAYREFMRVFHKTHLDNESQIMASLTAAYAAQFQSKEYAELIERLRNKVFYRNYWLEPEGDVPVLVDRDMANEEGVYSKLDNPAGQDAADAIEALLAERDAAIRKGGKENE